MSHTTRTTRRRKARRYAATAKAAGGNERAPSPPAAPPAAPPSDLGRSEIKAALRELGVDFDGRASTADLLNLLDEATNGDGR